MLKSMQDLFEEVIFSNLLEDEKFKCDVCKQQFEIKHDNKYELNGVVKGKHINTNVHMVICEYCICNIVNLDIGF